MKQLHIFLLISIFFLITYLYSANSVITINSGASVTLTASGANKSYLINSGDDDGQIIVNSGASFTCWAPEALVDFTASGDGDISLPVVLSTFTAQFLNNVLTLQWTTESEIENLGFIIERKCTVEANSDLPITWSPVASYLTDQALEGHGSTSEKHDYQFVDKAIQPGLTYVYRLGDVDYSGKVIWHPVVEVKVPENSETSPEEFDLHTAYPNPFNLNTTILYQLSKQSFVKLSIYNVSGILIETLVNEHKNAGYYSVIWNAENVSSGIYIYRIDAGGFSSVRKCLVVK